MNAADLERIEAQLQRERARILRSLDQLRSQVREGAERWNGAPAGLATDPEVGTAALRRDQSLAIAGQESRYLGRVERALERLHRSPETFGRCHSCGREIPVARLEVVPHTRYCIRCKSGIGETS